MIAHLRPYPSTETQQRLNSSLKYIELSLDKAEDSLSKNLEEE